MTEVKTASLKQHFLIGWIGVLLVRLIVPAWILFGAVHKAIGGNTQIPTPLNT